MDGGAGSLYKKDMGDDEEVLFVCHVWAAVRVWHGDRHSISDSVLTMTWRLVSHLT